MNTREKPRSPLRNIVNTDVSRIDILEHQLSEFKDLICTRFQSDNKHVEKHNSAISGQTGSRRSKNKPNRLKAKFCAFCDDIPSRDEKLKTNTDA